ncbi:PREDICTED: U-box domain-containing protein 52-like isoform X2 [Ipomoea nil]|uniref:U-box domain-containing protein 52-like isoform X2 n=1 Tax=Ipomoea nil TaxID=35883 RepID=UPI0009018D73|nr:PREDICTED: U-box domain-containing protein 52-like isoform X2 [Ipomoea nil]
MWGSSPITTNPQPGKDKKLIAVAIDKDRGSQMALKWSIENIVAKGNAILLLNVKLTQKPNQNYDICDENGFPVKELDPQSKELFLPFRVYCTRKDVQCHEILVEDVDPIKGIIDYVNRVGIEILILGAAAKGGLLRFKMKDIPGSVLKGVPDFCTVYVISKTGKISSTRSASRPVSFIHPLRQHLMRQHSAKSTVTAELSGNSRLLSEPSNASLQNDIKSPFTHRRGPNGIPYEISKPDTDISFVSSGRSSVDSIFPSYTDSFEDGPIPNRLSGFSDFDTNSFDSMNFGRRSLDNMTSSEYSFASMDSDRMSVSGMDDVEAEMRRLKQELKQTMEMYSTACKEALTARQKARERPISLELMQFYAWPYVFFLQAMELQRWKLEEQKRLDDALLAEEAAVAIAEREKAKSKAALEHAEAAQRMAEFEAQKRISAEIKAMKEAEETDKMINQFSQTDYRYRRYTIEEIEVATEYFSKSLKIGEGGYGPVYKCCMDHTAVAVKVLRPDAAHGRQQFQQEVEVLSCIRHPHMVLLLGACPEYGCLVYEHMSNGSLEDCLFETGKTPPLSWQHRFRIAAEICSGLLFLHQTKPEPIVHRDLKPGNILLDRNFVSKISDVGLARLVPPSVADSVTQYRMTSTAGTFCYIDPEYQQTGMLGVKSDVYSLGIIYLQILTAKSPMGLTHVVERAIEAGTFAEILDPAVRDWPVEDALSLANLSLQCAELRRKDRPDLGSVVMPELERLRTLAEENIQPFFYYPGHSPNYSQVSVSQENMSFPTGHSGYESSRSTPGL